MTTSLHPLTGASARHHLQWVAIAVAFSIAILGGCSSPGSKAAGSGSSRIQVVAAENFWGSIATQLGGLQVDVTSVITNPNTDPHDYEPTATDGREVAEARYVIENGVGYDPWIAKLRAANAAPGQRILDVGDMLGLKAGDNPHRWYFPANVQAVIDRITADYKHLDPGHDSYFDEQRTNFETVGLAGYHQLIGDIKAKYAGTPVGASESIFVGLADATGLDLITPPNYLKAISEGTDPTAADTATASSQIDEKQLKVFVYNSQNATPDIQQLVTAAKQRDIPVTTITETLVPANGSFQVWQTAQLQQLENALAKATGH